MNQLKYNLYECWLVGIFLLTSAGCLDDALPGSEPEREEIPASAERIFNAYIDNGPESRTAMGELKNGRYPVLWSEGDRVLIVDSRRNRTEATLIEGGGTNKAVFKGKSWNSQHLTSVYPAEGADVFVKSNYGVSKPDGSRYYLREIKATGVLPPVQFYQEETFTNNVFPMVGHCVNDYDFHYENIGGILQLPVKGEGTISQIILSGNDGEMIAGNFTVEYDYYYWSPDVNGQDTVTIDYLENEIAEADKEACNGRKILPDKNNSTQMISINFGNDGLLLNPDKPVMINIVLLPKTFKKGFTIRFIDKENKGFFEKKTSKLITIRRSYVKTMQAFDYQKPEPLEPANCYVVDKAGYYLIPAFCMGNRPISARLNVSDKGIYNKTGNPVAAAYLWTDAPGAITDVEYIPGKDGYISIKANAKNGQAPKGNTVIALYDSVTKEILWSWHIWMSDFKEVLTNGSCDGRTTDDGFTSDWADRKMIIMDRNLGATSGNKEDGSATYGLYYQVGRKDPFIGCSREGKGGGDDHVVDEEYLDKNHCDKNINSYTLFEEKPFGEYTAHTEWNTELAPDGWNYVRNYITAVHGYQHPMDYASNWGKNDDTRWTTKELNTSYPFVSNGSHEDFWNRTKTVNDPCPSGWTVLGKGKGSYGQPDNKLSKVYYDFENGVYGVELVYQIKGEANSSVWWPASGFRSVDGTLGNLGRKGYYWAYDHIDNAHGGHGTWFDIVVKKGSYIYKLESANSPMTNHASSIRCVKAKQP